jgi:hypothetical protein
MLGSRGDEARHVGVAADHSVHEHDVGALDLVGGLREIQQASLHAALDAGLARQRLRLRLVGRRELHVDRPLDPVAQELELQRPDSAADLENVPTLASNELDEPTPHRADPSPPVPRGVLPR